MAGKNKREELGRPMRPSISRTQARRLALALEAYYLLAGAESACLTDHMGDADRALYNGVVRQQAFVWLRQAGLDEKPDSVAEMAQKILGEDHPLARAVAAADGA